MSRHIFVVFGTRPEAIKLFPVIQQLRKENAKVTVCVTAQHRQMLDQVLEISDIKPDIDLDLMRPNQSLDELTARILLDLGKALDESKPDRVVVQGDTATAMVGALAAYYRKIPVSHVEAGLRSYDIYAPWPEEVNRKMIGSIADQHFAPTEISAQALLKENVPSEKVYTTGNTVIDALLWTKEVCDKDRTKVAHLDALRAKHAGRKIVLVTSHRRENFGGGMDRIGDALEKIVAREDVAIFFPVHPNPNVRSALEKRLTDHPRAELMPPLGYSEFVYLLSLADVVLTDSGGIQEEAPALGKPVLVMRETTERPEGVLAGTAKLVGTDTDLIVRETFTLLDNPDAYAAMARAHNPFGDGHAAEKIVKVLLS